MPSSLVALSAALLAYTGSAAATQFTLQDTYDSTNFFDNFNFYDQPDPNGGFVVYQNEANAIAHGLVGTTANNDVYLGVDYSTILNPNGAGRSSVRLESTAQYEHGLIIARFTHLPANTCGSWPAFWTVGDNWPMGGEIDLYENWNNAIYNQPAVHVGDSTALGQCLLSGAGQSSPVLTNNCDNTFQNPPAQYQNQGCTSAEYNGPYGSSNGGTYAIEWTSDYIKLYSWSPNNAPSNIDADSIDTASWGTPSVYLRNQDCNIDNHFTSQTIVLDITFCGNPAGQPSIWQQSCSSITRKATCAEYVASSPGDFAETYFEIQDIRYFQQASTSTTSSQTSTSTTASSSTASSTSAAATTTTASSSTATSSGLTSSTSNSAQATTSSATSSSTYTFTGTGFSPSCTSSWPTFRWTNTSAPAVPTTTSTTSAVVLPSTTSETTSSNAVSSTTTETTSNAVSSTATVTTSNAVSSTTTETTSGAVLPTTTVTTSGVALPSSTVTTSGAVLPTTTVTTSGAVLPTTTETTPVQMTTSTVYTTTVHTVTKCPPWVVDCPAGGYVTTETKVLYTTICPVTATETSRPTVTAQPSPVQLTTSTVYTTSVYTVTKCPPYVANCPAGGYVTTETIALYTTICPVTATEKPGQPIPTLGAGQDSALPAASSAPGSGSGSGPSPQESGVPAAPSSAPGSGSGSGAEETPEGSPAPTVTNGFTVPAAVQPSQTTVVQVTATVLPQPIAPPAGSGNETLTTTYATQPSGGPAPSGQVPPAEASGSEGTGKSGSGSVKTGVSTIALVGALVAVLLL